jgi:glutaredoxin
VANQPEPSATAAPTRVTLIGRSGCHLCDEARAVVAAVAAETGVGWVERCIDDDPALAEYAEQIPVVLVDGRRHDFWRVDAERLREALRGQRRWFSRR